MLFCDGVMIQSNRSGPREFVTSNECFLGVINDDNYRRIDWHPVDAHPGQPRYRMAAAGIDAMNSVAFVGGSINPYNFSGIGYNSLPSEPSAETLVFDLGRKAWTKIDSRTPSSMDHRGLVQFKNDWYTVGGMLGHQTMTGRVLSRPLETRE